MGTVFSFAFSVSSSPISPLFLGVPPKITLGGRGINAGLVGVAAIVVATGGGVLWGFSPETLVVLLQILVLDMSGDRVVYSGHMPLTS